MKNLPISKLYPELIHLRLYLYQLIEESFGLSDEIRNDLIDTFGGYSPEIIDSLTIEDLTSALTWDYFPESLFVFKDEHGNLPSIITDISPNDSLSFILDKCTLNEVALPVLYTGICQVSFENDGLLIMEKYKTQIYNCCLPSGESLFGDCHDCELGFNGLILSRGSSDSDICYELSIWNGVELVGHQSFWPSEYPDVFPHLGSRDLIPEMLRESEHITDYYPEVEYESVEDVYQLLTNFSGSFRVLVHEYSNNQELALAAVQSNILAFTFLSEELRRNISFIKMLFEHLSEPFQLYNYLDEDIRKEYEIISYVYRKYPRSLENLELIKDGQMIVNLFNDGFYDAGKYINLLSDTLKNDHEFLLNLAKIDWRKLLEHSPELYTNVKFIEKLIFDVDEYFKSERKDINSTEIKLLNSADKKKEALNQGIKSLFGEYKKNFPKEQNFEDTVYKYILSLPKGIKLIEENKDILNKLSLEFIVRSIREEHLFLVLDQMGLNPLSAATAEILAKSTKTLRLSELTSISDTAADSLSKHQGHLDLSGLTCLSDAAADSLSKHQGYLDLSGLTSLSDAAAESLSKHKGTLDLSGLASLTDAAVESLSKSFEYLSYNTIKFLSKSLTSLSATAAESLSKYKGDLDLSGLTSLSDAAAESLSKYKGDLDLSGLTSLSDAAAKSLSKHKSLVYLSGLTSLSDAAAESLSKHENYLDLSGLTSLSDAAAESLSKHEYYLNLAGLTSLSDAAAEFLSKHKGSLNLSGLISLSDAAAESLSKHKGTLKLSSLISLSDAAAEFLNRTLEDDLPF